MNRFRMALWALILPAAVVAASAQTGTTDPETRLICASVASVQLPAGDRPTPDEARGLADCVSVDLYYGFGHPPDVERARRCAYLEMDRGDSAPPFGGRAMLMTVYANGKGGARNFDAALMLACSIGGAPQDISGRVRHLARLKTANWTGDTFSPCDHSSGPVLYRQCAELQDRFDTADRAKELDAIVRAWRPPDREAFEVFRRAADEFYTSHARKEANLDVTVMVQERAFLENELIASLRRFETGDVPRFAAIRRRDAEARMSAAYAATQQGTTHRWGTATSESIRETQRAWTSYRDAWLAFGTRRYPSVSADSWGTWLAEERAAMLERFQQ